jgi:3-deoxy-D-manno-octulosonic-acid transferase
LKACSGGLEIQDYDDFERQMQQLETDQQMWSQCAEAAGDYVKSRSGATQKVLQAVSL